MKSKRVGVLNMILLTSCEDHLILIIDIVDIVANVTGERQVCRNSRLNFMLKGGVGLGIRMVEVMSELRSFLKFYPLHLSRFFLYSE